MLDHARSLGKPLKLADKAYVCADFIASPKKNSKRQSRWKAHKSKMRKRVETVSSQLVNAHLRIGQYQTLKALKARSALTILAHNLKIWGITA